ncbi:MAG TPA: Uma2 family endonuclease [Polyangiales bacterium]
MADPARRRATYEDVLKAPDHCIAQVVDGELHVHPRPASAHQAVASNLGGELFQPFGRGRGGPGGWIILDEPEVHLNEHIVVPDLAGWRRERMPVVENVPYFTLSPDWVCEIVSPSTARLDRVRKLPLYARHGVRHVWIIDPLARTLEVYRLEGQGWLLVSSHEQGERVRAEPFDAFELELDVLWADIKPEQEPA